MLRFGPVWSGFIHISIDNYSRIIRSYALKAFLLHPSCNIFWYWPNLHCLTTYVTCGGKCSLGILNFTCVSYTSLKITELCEKSPVCLIQFWDLVTLEWRPHSRLRTTSQSIALYSSDRVAPAQACIRRFSSSFSSVHLLTVLLLLQLASQIAICMYYARWHI